MNHPITINKIPSPRSSMAEWILVHHIDDEDPERTGWCIALKELDGTFADFEGPYEDMETAVRMRDLNREPFAT